MWSSGKSYFCTPLIIGVDIDALLLWLEFYWKSKWLKTVLLFSFCWYNYKKSKKQRNLHLLIAVLLSFLIKLSVSGCTNKKLWYATFGIHTYFLQEWTNFLDFWNGKYSKLFQYKFPKSYLPNPMHRRQVITFRR